MSATLLTIGQMVEQSLIMIGEYTPSETPENKYFSEGVMWMNLILRTLSASGINIPFQSLLTFNLVPNKIEYTIGQNPPVDVVSNYIVSITAGNVLLNNQEYPLTPLGFVQYDNSYKSITSTGLPRYYVLDNALGVSTVIIYPIPDQTYICNLRVKSVISPVNLNSQITDIPDYYQQLLIYELSAKLANLYPTALWDEKRQNELRELRQLMLNTNSIDLTLSPSSICCAPWNGFYYLTPNGFY
jgi:hypothetical protein